MYRIKAIAAVALAGLGGATIGTDAYMASHGSPPAREVPIPIHPVPEPPTAQAVAPSPVVMLEPVTIESRLPARHKIAAAAPAAEERTLVPCSDWRSLETGPSDRGVRTLCFRAVSAR